MPATDDYLVRDQAFTSLKAARDYAKTASSMCAHSTFNITHQGRVVATYYQGRPRAELVLWGRRAGESAFDEQIITALAGRIEPARQWAEANGFAHLRIQIVDQATLPDFRSAIAA